MQCFPATCKATLQRENLQSKLFRCCNTPSSQLVSLRVTGKIDSESSKLERITTHILQLAVHYALVRITLQLARKHVFV